ncbi:MAG: class I SAM-dependent methyltransferase [Nitriliruptorales bacterium]
MKALTVDEIRNLDPYALMAVLGKRIIHPGGRRATDQLLQWAQLQPDEEVLDVGCGVGTTAIRMALQFRVKVTAADVAPMMVERAQHHVRRAGVGGVRVEQADILDLPYEDASFDCVVAEAVTMFVDRARAARELVRVCRPEGRVLATEFFWLRPPTPEARQIFLGEVCPGLQFDSVEDWVSIYKAAGLTDLRTSTGPFEMMTPRGFLADEGMAGTLAFGAQALTRITYLRKLAWLMPRMARSVPYLGYIVVAGRVLA